MSVVDLHPDDLLDREARGALSPQETERLERHLAQCKTCRFERLVRADFRGDEEPLEADFDVQRLLSEVLAPGADRALLRAAERPQRARRPVARGLRPLFLVAAAVLVTGASLAAVGVLRVRAEGAPIAARVERPVTPTLNVAPTPVPPPATGSAIPALPPPPPIVRAAAATGFALSAAHASPPAASPERGSPAPLASVPVVAPAATVVSDAAVLFERANRARRAGDHARAAELYGVLLDRFPTSPEAHESQAVLGRELLGDGQAAGALSQFDAYLKTGGALREDVMADRARALGNLGRPRDEADAWGALLRAYPASVHAERARARLSDLGR